MAEQSNPLPEQPPAEKNILRRTASGVAGGIGCLMLLIALPVAAVAVLAIVLDDPAFWIAVVALIVAVAAFKANRGR